MQRLSISRNHEAIWQHRFQLLALLISTLWLLRHVGSAETYWAFVPNPPLIHAVTWEEATDIPVYNNQTLFMGQYSDDHIQEFSAKINYTGQLHSLPICFQVNQTNPLCEQIILQENWDTNVTTGIHWAMDFYYPNFTKHTKGSGRMPPHICSCGTIKSITPNGNFAPGWRLCHANETTCSSTSLCDWSVINENGRPINLVSAIWTKNNRTYYTNLWKAVAALGPIKAKKVSVTWEQIDKIWAMRASQNTTVFYMRACLPEPYAFLTGNFSVNSTNVMCTECNIMNCINSSSVSFLLVKQPSYVYIPVNLTHDWYADRGTEVLEIVTQRLLSRQKRVLGLIIAGIAALITAITVTTVASVSLSQSIQTANYVNDLTVNISKALKNQERMDEKKGNEAKFIERYS